MFGRNRMSQEEIEKLKRKVELDDLLFTDIEEGREMFDATVTELDESFRQTEAGVTQVQENIKAASELASDNVRIESDLIFSIGDYRNELAETKERQRGIRSDMKELCDRFTELVDENKHFTTPSKQLNEFPNAARNRNDAFSTRLDEMEACSKQMGVLALNAAIEAGRMGDSSSQFVNAAEDIRSYASRYDTIISDSRRQLEEDNARIGELEDQVHRLVSLLKENNIATARLMKSCKEVLCRTDEMIESSKGDRIGDIGHQITALRNADEEIVKSEERNRMQTEDLASEFTAQKNHQAEIQQMMDPVFRHVVERKAAIES
jgi:small-conductance mechanosensitive channel